MAFSSTSSTSVIMRTEERAFARLLSRAFTPAVWREGAAERMSASIPTFVEETGTEDCGHVWPFSPPWPLCDPRVAQPCIHAVWREVLRREDEREHPSAFARKRDGDGRMRTSLEVFICRIHLHALRRVHMRACVVRWICPHPASGCNSCELSDVSSTRQTTATLTCTATVRPAGGRALSRLGRAVTSPPTCTATAAHRRPPPASVLSSVCR